MDDGPPGVSIRPQVGMDLSSGQQVPQNLGMENFQSFYEDQPSVEDDSTYLQKHRGPLYTELLKTLKNILATYLKEVITNKQESSVVPLDALDAARELDSYDVSFGNCPGEAVTTAIQHVLTRALKKKKYTTKVMQGIIDNMVRLIQTFGGGISEKIADRFNTFMKYARVHEVSLSWFKVSRFRL
jgi:hypothetical protein